MTLEEIRRSDKLLLTPKDVAEVLGCDAQTLRTAARDHPERLGFPTMRAGKMTKIPRKPFLAFLGEGGDGKE
jgi:hypothetical protein